MKIYNNDEWGLDTAIRGMRNSWCSHEKSDDGGDKDVTLMKKLIKAGVSHRKFLRFIQVSFDIEMPLYWWKHFDTYKVGTNCNSESTMHTIMKKELTINDFEDEEDNYFNISLRQLNSYINLYKKTKDKFYFNKVIKRLPCSFIQKRTVQTNYEVLLKIIHERKNHKLREWEFFIEKIYEFFPLLKEFVEIL